MTILSSDNSLVLIIDVQEKLLNAVFNKFSVEKNSKIIANAAKLLNIPVILTEQYPKGLGNTVAGIKEILPEDAQYYEKTTFSALDNLEVLNAIKESGRKQIVLYGIETHICVSQTAAALSSLGYEVYAVSDACGSRAECEYLAGLSRMKDNGAQLVTTEIALFEWLRGAKHPSFKEIQSLIK